jgi:UDP-2-acetamido-3-amino-2,3-dideoxy-glucuronate N-acetyltransferase
MVGSEAPAQQGVFIHPQGLCESADVGSGTRIWAFAHVMAGSTIGSLCTIGDHAFVESGAILGDRVTLKNGVMVWEGVHIESDVFVGPGVIFTNDRLPRSPRMADVTEVRIRYEAKHHWLETTHIGQGASLGAGAVIAPGVRIGAYAMVGAGSVVVRDVAPNALVVGNPARHVGWVCRAGSRLSPQRGDALDCTKCGRRITLTESGPRSADGC